MNTHGEAGKAGFGTAWQGRAGQGAAGMARLGKAWQGLARHGEAGGARQGVTRQGGARHGMAGAAGQGRTRQGSAGPGATRLGTQVPPVPSSGSTGGTLPHPSHADLGQTAVCSTCGSVYFARSGCPNGHAAPSSRAGSPPAPRGLSSRCTPSAPTPIAGGRGALVLIGGAW